MDEQTLLAIEERFWRGGAEHYREALATDALMVFAPPAGVLDRAGTLASIEQAPRWQAVSFAAVHVARPAADVVVLVYQARAARENGAAPYDAQCSSVYVRQGAEGWRLALHQQTPLQASASQ
jgi:hypothetical protein